MEKRKKKRANIGHHKTTHKLLLIKRASGFHEFHYPKRRILATSVGAMALSIKLMSLAVTGFGVLSFILGIIAENKKPPSGVPITGKGVVICKYPFDPTVVLGFLSVVSLAASAMLGFYSIFHPYDGKSAPRNALFQSTTMIIFFQIAVWVSLLGEGMLLWATFTELLHLVRNVHHNMDAQCTTAKTGLFGGAAFLALDASLFWLICLLLANNARDDYFDKEEVHKGDYSLVYETQYDAKGQDKGKV
ncbi:hypothetical protein L1049_004372 [Liquidambar formosana]|uniref:Uncharacterized protein n=1 Tax=Liquidambar formosana TaxID=63359 RepID=A0AAP0WVM0_LIQFO